MAELTEETRRFLTFWNKPGGGVTDVPIQLVRQKVEKSAKFSGGEYEAVANVKDQTLPARGGGTFKIRLYIPRMDSNTKFPAILYLHGGGWAIGSINTVDKICRRLAKKADAAVVSVDYRLSPEHTFPAHLDDVEDAYIWLIKFANASSLICPKKLSVSGDSAGGNLAAALNVRLRNSGMVVPEYRPKYQLLVYPCLDLTYSLKSHLIFGEGYGLDKKALSFFQKSYLGENLDKNALDRLARNPEVSPLFTEDYSLFPPTLLIVAQADCLFSDSIEYAKGLRAAGVAVRTVVYPGVVHAFFSFEEFFPEASLALQECILALKAAGLTGDQAVGEGPRMAKL